MKIIKYFCIFLILVVGLSILMPLSAFSIQKLDKDSVTYCNGNSYISTSIVSTNIGSDYKMKKDLNKIEKVIIKINGKTVRSFYKGKSWNKSEYYPMAIIDRETMVKGNIKGKKVGIFAYGKNNKLLKSQVGKIKSIKVSKSITSKNEAIFAAKQFLKIYHNDSNLKISDAKLVVNKYGGIWHVSFMDIRTGEKKGSILISDETGDIATI